MLARSHVPRLESTLRARALRPPPGPRWLRWSSAAAHPERIAVLGGGIAGLASAYFASKEFPHSKITVYESGPATGGWIRSQRVQVPGGEVLFESGPRTLRNATPTAHLIEELGLGDAITATTRSEPGAKNRFVYYPDRLNRLPSEAPGVGDVFALWRSGILDGALGLLKEPWQPRRPAALSDETVGAFLARRVDARVANNIVSAVFHGIYAGDIWQLSARTLLAMAWQLEGRYGTALGGFFRMQSESPSARQQVLAHPYDVDVARALNRDIALGPALAAKLQAASMFTFTDGLQTLVRALQAALEHTGNVEVRVDSPVASFKMAAGDAQQVEIVAGQSPSAASQSPSAASQSPSAASQPPERYDVVISTLRNAALTPYVTVMTVNLYYDNPALLPVEGFGYLIPQSVPFEQNPERALGVIFDSSAIKGQDTAPGTKLTVMLGGHWWAGFEGFPDEQEGLAMARAVVERHLGITDTPTAHFVNLSKDCIPQYTLGYEDRLRDFAASLQHDFKGRLRVVGNQFNGVGVNDCITGAWNVARGLRGDGWKSTSCGLDRVLDSRPWAVVDAADMVYKRRDDSKSDPFKP